jgi:hypothetical protein
MNNVYQLWVGHSVKTMFENAAGEFVAVLELKTGPICQDVVYEVEHATECLAFSLFKGGNYWVHSSRDDHTTGFNYMGRDVSYDTQAIYEAINRSNGKEVMQ